MKRNILKNISNNDIVIYYQDKELMPTEAIRLISTGDLYPIDSEGKLFVHQTSKVIGTMTYWTGRGDKIDDVTDAGNGGEFTLYNHPGAPESQSIYLDFNTINNKSYIHEGYLIWKNCRIGDFVTLEAVTNTVSYVTELILIIIYMVVFLLFLLPVTEQLK